MFRARWKGPRTPYLAKDDLVAVKLPFHCKDEEGVIPYAGGEVWLTPPPHCHALTCAFFAFPRYHHPSSSTSILILRRTRLPAHPLFVHHRCTTSHYNLLPHYITTVHLRQFKAGNLSGLRHRNIVTFYGTWKDPTSGNVGLVTEYCDGGSLNSQLRFHRGKM